MKVTVALMRCFIRIIVLTALTVVSCGIYASVKDDTVTTTTIQELPLPAVPESITTPERRAAYVIEHFWDAMDFSDSTAIANDLFMEQTFANYASLFPLVDSLILKGSVEQLMKRAEVNRDAYNRIADIADTYLYNLDSPMLDEEAYILFLEAITSGGFMEKTRMSRYEYQLADASKNRKGHIANNFAFVDSEGNNRSLYAVGEIPRLIIFYDPDCDHCTEVIAQINASAPIINAITSGRLKVLAIYSDGDPAIWERAKSDVPHRWIGGYSPDGAIEGDELYVLRAMPSLYLIDADNRVILKDRQIEEFIKEIEKL